MVIAIIAVVAGLSFSAFTAVRKSADKATAAAQMRQIGSAIVQFSADHNQYLPGPIWPGQKAYFDPADPDNETRLVAKLAPYLGIPEDETQIVEVFMPPAYRREYEGDLTTARTYVMNMSVLVNEEIVNVWGSAVPSAPDHLKRPMTLVAIPDDAWLMSDADQENPRVANAPWVDNTPPEPIHGRKRAALFFGGHVDFVDQEILEEPKEGETGAR